MTICINKNGDIFEELISISEDQLDETNLDYPITHALVVAKSRQGYLLLFNTWKQQWELAGGILEPGETLRQCALREMMEETNQVPDRIEFRGLMKFILKKGKTEYGGLYSANIDKERPFVKNDEADEIVFWDGEQNIGYIDEIDKELLKFY